MAHNQTSSELIHRVNLINRSGMFKCGHDKTWANTVIIGQYAYERCRKCWNESMRRAYHARKERKRA